MTGSSLVETTSTLIWTTAPTMGSGEMEIVVILRGKAAEVQAVASVPPNMAAQIAWSCVALPCVCLLDW